MQGYITKQELSNELKDEIENSKQSNQLTTNEITKDDKSLDIYLNEKDEDLTLFKESTNKKINNNIDQINLNKNDINNKAEQSDLDNVTNNIINMDKKIDIISSTSQNSMLKTGDKFTGIVQAQSNTSYSVKQIRNIVVSFENITDNNNDQLIDNGDLWIKLKL